MSNRLRAAALATALASALSGAPAFAALQLSDAFDGAVFNPAENGRGAFVDVAKSADGSSIYSMAMFTYDSAGAPTWLLMNATLSEFQYRAINVDVFRFSGGSFGSPFVAPTGASIGKASLEVHSCGRTTVELTMNTGSGFANSNFTYQPVSGSNQCVYTREFAGCPTFATAAPAYGTRACQISGSILDRDITLTNEITWVLEGKVGVGADNANPSTLRIEPGTLIVGSGDTFDHLAVLRGSKIYAEGTRTSPIILTSPFELPGASRPPQSKDIGGFVISGKAPANCNPNCTAEWDPTNKYGGTDAADNSGVVRYMQVRYAGYIFTTNRELNSFTMNAVGSGTTLEYLQSYRGGDDGVEFFGGTANMRNFVDSCGGDDGIDWDEGFSGKVQFALLNQRGCDGQDHGFESANSPTNFDATPRARPSIANVTVRGGGTGSRDGLNLKEGTGGNFFNIAVTGFARSCIGIEGLPTQTAAGPTTALTGALTLTNSVIDCTTNFREGTGVTAGYSQAWFQAQAGNTAAPLALAGYLPTAASPIGNKPFNPQTDWFVPTDYAGGFRSNAAKDNWAAGWTHRLND